MFICYHIVTTKTTINFDHLPILEGSVSSEADGLRLVRESGILITHDPRETYAKLTLAQLLGILPKGHVINTVSPVLLVDGGVSDSPRLGQIIEGNTTEPHLVYATTTRIYNGFPRAGRLSDIHTVPLSQISLYSRLGLPLSYNTQP